MSKTDITLEQARAVVDRVAQETGLLTADTSGFIKVQSPSTKHRIYVQLSKRLNRIDSTMEMTDAAGNQVPGTLGVSNPNGSIKCHLEPTLENLEFHLRRLNDATLGVQVPNKPRPFAPSKTPIPRKPKPVAAPVPEEALVPVGPANGEEPSIDPDGLRVRLANIKARARDARIRRYVEDGHSHDEAVAIVEGRVKLADLQEAAANREAADVTDLASEAGVELS
jgi:hypothetical protein